MIPQTPAILDGNHNKLVVDRDHKDPSIRDCRPAAHRRADGGFPDNPAIFRIERQNLRITRRDIETVVPEGDTPAERIPVLVIGPEIDLPESVSSPSIERADLHPAVHRINPTLGDYRLRQHARIS